MGILSFKSQTVCRGVREYFDVCSGSLPSYPLLSLRTVRQSRWLLGGWPSPAASPYSVDRITWGLGPQTLPLLPSPFRFSWTLFNWRLPGTAVGILEEPEVLPPLYLSDRCRSPPSTIVTLQRLLLLFASFTTICSTLQAVSTFG